MINPENLRYFEILGIEPTDDVKAIKTAYNTLAKKYHPDTGGEEADAVEFDKICNAYKMLTDEGYAKHRSHVERTPSSIKDGLKVTYRYPAKIDERFYGRDVTFSINRIVFDKSKSPIAEKCDEVVVFMFKVPAGLENVFQIPFPGYGNKDIETGIIGDGIIEILPIPDKKFTLSHGNVMSDESIPLEIMLKGGEHEFDTMLGKAIFKIPVGSKPGDQVKLKGYGPMGKGYHIVKLLDPLWPSKRDLANKDSWSSLKVAKEEINLDGFAFSNEDYQSAFDYVLRQNSYAFNFKVNDD